MIESAFFGPGGGFLMINALEGKIVSADSEHLVRLTITGLTGRTEYMYLTPAQAIDASLLLVDASRDR